MLLSGKEVSAAKLDELSRRCEKFVSQYGFRPTLAVILVGNNPASMSYVNSKKKTCCNLGFGLRDYELEDTISQDELLSLIRELNDDDSVHGILVQLPLPEGFDEELVIETISPDKDVDGFHPMNLGRLLIGLDCFVSCTPKGILALLDYYNIETAGKNVVIVGRSNIVGKPMAVLLSRKGRDATVTLCHSRTENLKEKTLSADILIAAVGRYSFITADMIKPGAVVIDVGINRIADPSAKKGYRVRGDVDFENAKEVASYITPVPGGVGPMTIAMLMENTFESAEKVAERI